MNKEKLEALNKAKSQQITRLEEQNEALKSEITDLKNDYKSLNAENIRLHEHNLTLRGKIAAYEEVVKNIFAYKFKREKWVKKHIGKHTYEIGWLNGF